MTLVSFLFLIQHLKVTYQIIFILYLKVKFFFQRLFFLLLHGYGFAAVIKMIDVNALLMGLIEKLVFGRRDKSGALISSECISRLFICRCSFNETVQVLDNDYIYHAY